MFKKKIEEQWKIEQAVVDLLKQKKKEIGYELPIDEDTLKKIFEWFANQETMLSNQYCEGLYHDRKYLDLIAKGLDNFNTDNIDLEDLNKRLTG